MLRLWASKHCSYTELDKMTLDEVRRATKFALAWEDAERRASDPKRGR